MSDNKDDADSGAEFLLEMAKHQGGVACATVKDGHVLVFSKQALMNLLATCSEQGKEQVIVFVKRTDMSKAS